MHCMSVADPASGRRTRRTADPGGGVPGAVPHVAPTHTRRTAAGLGTNEPQTGNGSTRGPHRHRLRSPARTKRVY